MKIALEVCRNTKYNRNTIKQKTTNHFCKPSGIQKAAKHSAPPGYIAKRQYTNFLSSLDANNKKQQSFLQTLVPWTSAHIVLCLWTSSTASSTIFRICPCQSRHCRNIAVFLFLIFSLCASRRRRKFLLWLGGFEFFERRVLNVRKARKIQNNDARMKINKPYFKS